MRTMSAKEAKTRFGELLLEAQKGPVTIEKNGRPVAVMYSMESHEAAEKSRMETLRQAVAEGVAAADRGELVPFDEAVIADVTARGASVLDDEAP
ncbi:MAG: type II toxin-antitoxin system Phd/YefM family antitoxin [Geminicoccaceae bacterium]|nr:type II toxin-antitoxin system Phd/YefM family antitoxin [Geminicoccaceae bacterium]